MTTMWGETKASTPADVRETGASTLDVVGETKASTKRIGGGEIKTSTDDLGDVDKKSRKALKECSMVETLAGYLC